MEQIKLGGRRVVGFGIGDLPSGTFPSAAESVSGESSAYNGIDSSPPEITSSPNPAYRATAAITGQKIDPNTPPDVPADPTAVQKACAGLPKWQQAIAGCSNANTKLKPGESAPTGPASWWTLPFGGGVDAEGKPILSPIEWLEAHQTLIAAIAIGAAIVTTVVIGGVVYALVRR